MSFIQELREFAVKGNVIDMAVGIVVGVAFNNIVSSLVADVLMPPIGLILGGEEFKHLRLVLQAESTTATGEQVAEVAIRYGAFGNAVLQFLIIALSAFLVVKAMNRIIRRREVAA